MISPSRRNLTNGNKPPSSKGKAVIHEDFRATVIDGRIGRQLADLAVIQLEEPLGDINPDGKMPEVGPLHHPADEIVVVRLGLSA